MAERKMVPELDVRSHLLSGFMNVIGILAAYGLIIAFMLWFLFRFHDLDILGLLFVTFKEIAFILPRDIVSFLTEIAGEHIFGLLLVAVIYSVYLNNFRLSLYRGKIYFRKGFVSRKPVAIDVADIEEVYTKPYPFLSHTKMLCLMTLDEETIKIPYVLEADEAKQRILAVTKRRLRREK